MKRGAEIIRWDEIGESPTIQREHDGVPIMLTYDNDEILVADLREIYGEKPEAGDPGNYYWRIMGISHQPRTTTIEWRSGRGHHGVTVILWSLE